MGDANWKACGKSVRRTLKRFFDKTLENLSSMKMYVIIGASVLLYFGKLDAEYWFYTMAVCVATRNVIEVLSVVKDIRLGKSSALPSVPPEKTDGTA